LNTLRAVVASGDGTARHAGTIVPHHSPTTCRSPPRTHGHARLIRLGRFAMSRMIRFSAHGLRIYIRDGLVGGRISKTRLKSQDTGSSSAVRCLTASRHGIQGCWSGRSIVPGGTDGFMEVCTLRWRTSTRNKPLQTVVTCRVLLQGRCAKRQRAPGAPFCSKNRLP
jgi:hypothetical protein